MPERSRLPKTPQVVSSTECPKLPSNSGRRLKSSRYRESRHVSCSRSKSQRSEIPDSWLYAFLNGALTGYDRLNQDLTALWLAKILLGFEIKSLQRLVSDRSDVTPERCSISCGSVRAPLPVCFALVAASYLKISPCERLLVMIFLPISK